mmetsp:Transcript_31408/g.83585  ORF Transcript_31408/g.83585 Transcript_31408/m.83585 type:complete len:91 (-) Transcript_31408:259-531(-)
MPPVAQVARRDDFHLGTETVSEVEASPLHPHFWTAVAMAVIAALFVVSAVATLQVKSSGGPCFKRKSVRQCEHVHGVHTDLSYAETHKLR